MRPIVLASASPRRRELLGQIATEFDVVVSEVDEEALTVSDPWQTAERLAEAKALAVRALRPEATVIGGDTVVALEDGTQLAKPSDVQDAMRMLLQLSAREHLVITGVCVASEGQVQTASDTTRVRFRELSKAEIRDYVASGEPMDKAGAYAIQGGAAGFVESIDGSISNVIGLPMELLRRMLGN